MYQLIDMGATTLRKGTCMHACMRTYVRTCIVHKRADKKTCSFLWIPHGSAFAGYQTAPFLVLMFTDGAVRSRQPPCLPENCSADDDDCNCNATVSQEAELRARPDIVVCTPGRMVDHLTNSASVHMDDVEILVLDEVFFTCDRETCRRDCQRDCSGGVPVGLYSCDVCVASCSNRMYVRFLQRSRCFDMSFLSLLLLYNVHVYALFASPAGALCDRRTGCWSSASKKKWPSWSSLAPSGVKPSSSPQR